MRQFVQQILQNHCKQNQYKKGFSQIILIIILWVAFAGAISYFIFIQQGPNPLPIPGPAPVPTPIACTQEAKQCPDGSYVGRTGPNCEFAPCPKINPPSITECIKDSDCPSPQYICQETQGIGTACPSNDPSCAPTYTIIKGECKLREGNRCVVDSDCASGNLCNKNICVSPIGRQCSGLNDKSCPTDYECVQGCGPPVVRYPDDTPPSYFCQLKGYDRPCPICLSKDTLIDAPFGDVKVQNLKEGDKVWTINGFGERVSALILKTGNVKAPSNHKMVHLVFQDGRELFVSPGHPTIDGRMIGDFDYNDFYNGARIVAVNLIEYDNGVTYDILPAGETGFYWANGILLGSTLH